MTNASNVSSANTGEWPEFEAWLSDIARELSVLTGSAWSAEFNELKGYHVAGWLNGPDGARISTHYNKARQRAEFTPCWPGGGNYHNPGVRPITVAAFKLGAARDISRRLLRGYLLALAEAHAAIAERKAKDDAAAALLTDLVSASGGVLRSVGAAYPREARVTGHEDYYGKLTVAASSQYVNLELGNLSPAVARKIVELLAHESPRNGRAS